MDPKRNVFAAGNSKVPVDVISKPRATIFFVKNLEKVDYESDTPFPGWEEQEGKVRQRRDVSPTRILRTPCPFSDLSTAEELLKAAYRTALLCSYLRSVIDPRVENGSRSAEPATEAKDAITRSLGVYIVGPQATTQTEFDQRKALRARFLVPHEIPMDWYPLEFELERRHSCIRNTNYSCGDLS
ncbi:hypothetical protein Plhal710r2_c049g0153531 [Plasmopara halstedii]